MIQQLLNKKKNIKTTGFINENDQKGIQVKKKIVKIKLVGRNLMES